MHPGGAEEPRNATSAGVQDPGPSNAARVGADDQPGPSNLPAQRERHGESGRESGRESEDAGDSVGDSADSGDGDSREHVGTDSDEDADADAEH